MGYMRKNCRFKKEAFRKLIIRSMPSAEEKPCSFRHSIFNMGFDFLKPLFVNQRPDLDRLIQRISHF